MGAEMFMLIDKLLPLQKNLLNYDEISIEVYYLKHDKAYNNEDGYYIRVALIVYESRGYTIKVYDGYKEKIKKYLFENLNIFENNTLFIEF